MQVCVSTRSHKDEIAERSISQNVSPSLSDAYLYVGPYVMKLFKLR